MNGTIIRDLMKYVGTQDLRELFEALHNWGYGQDFTYSKASENIPMFIRAFVMADYVDSPFPISSFVQANRYLKENGDEPLTEKEEREIYKAWRKLGVN